MYIPSSADFVATHYRGPLVCQGCAALQDRLLRRISSCLATRGGKYLAIAQTLTSSDNIPVNAWKAAQLVNFIIIRQGSAIFKINFFPPLLYTIATQIIGREVADGNVICLAGISERKRYMVARASLVQDEPGCNSCTLS